ncbi:MAG: branched-subunit amino acid ABC-type transport system permease component, partial [Glaciecola sp.]
MTLLTSTVLAAINLGEFIIDEGAVALGAINGIVYGLLAVGLVLAYRSSRVINFAHGEVGAFAAAIMALVANRFSVPYWPALLLAMIIGAATSAGIEATVVRRLRSAPRVLTIVATLGAGSVLTALAFVVNAGAGAGTRYPQPPGLPTFTVGALPVNQARMGMLILGPLAMAAIAVGLARSRYGLAIRAAAANPESASTIGVSPRRMATWSWALAGALAALTAALVIPTRGAAIGEAFGVILLVRALAAAVLARMTRIWVAAI